MFTKSSLSADTTAEFFSRSFLVTSGAFQTISTMTWALTAMSPRLHVSWPPDGDGGFPQAGFGAETNVPLAGSVSTIRTFSARNGPRFLATSVYVTSSPPSRNTGSPIFWRITSDRGASTMVCSVSLLLPVFAKGSLLDVTVTVLSTSVSVSGEGALISMSIVIILSGSMSLVTVQVTTTGPSSHTASAEVVEISVEPGGSVSLTTTFMAVCSPTLSTVMR